MLLNLVPVAYYRRGISFTGAFSDVLQNKIELNFLSHYLDVQPAIK